jgi:hypothetical protein
LFLVALAAAIGPVACDNGSTEPENQRPDATELFPGLTVSDTDGGGGPALAAGTSGIAYISACPGTFSDADGVTITNLANGESKTVPIVDGGFDPVTLEAEPDDELEIIVHHSDGTTNRYLTRVPPRKRPRVVRTVPPKDATDVVLSTSALVVFSEPVDSSSVTAENVRLLLDGEPVAGTLALSEDGLRVEFTPAEPLQPSTTYILQVTSGVLDLDGDPLVEQPITTFTTEGEFAQVLLCAKQRVVDEINQIQEIDKRSWEGPVVNSTRWSCHVADSPLRPVGTFTYRVAGPQFEWSFEGGGFLPYSPTAIYHRYVAILYPDPWPGRRLVCLDLVRNNITPDETGRLRLSGSVDLGRDLVNAKIWIVRRHWVDCSGHDYDIDINDVPWPNHDGVPRLTNDRNQDGRGDASETLHWCSPNCGWGNADLAYDWLFETALVNYRDTDG